jgi:hypothetical protein
MASSSHLGDRGNDYQLPPISTGQDVDPFFLHLPLPRQEGGDLVSTFCS